MTQSNSSSSIPTQLFHLAAATSMQPATTLAADFPPTVNGLPAFYYWKDAIVVGSYTHPAGSFSLDITRDKLDGYAGNFKRMQSNGVAVPILMDHTQSAAATLGWIVQVQRDGDRLLELHQFLGESARDIGLRNKVSLGIDPNFIDGKGNHYGEAIVHSAITPVPVVPNQDGFEPVELHNNESQMILLSLAAPEVEPPHLARREDTPGSLTETDPVQIPNDNPPCNHSGLNGDLTKLAYTALTDAAAAKRDLAIARGAIDPTVANELFTLLVRTPDPAANIMTLSHHGNSAPLALAVFDLLAKNHPTPLGESTSLQVLSRNVPGLDDERTELQQRMIELASGR